MTKSPDKAHEKPSVLHDGRAYPLQLEPSGWRLRSQAKARRFNFRTGTTNLTEAKRRAREWLAREADNPMRSRKGGGTLAKLAEIYLKTPKRTKDEVAADNVSRLKGIVRVVFDDKTKKLEDVTCNEVGPELWQKFQRKKLGKKFDLATRYAENIAINSAVRAARCLFLPALLRAYRAEGLTVREDAGQAVMLPEPTLPLADADDKAVSAAWRKLQKGQPLLWLTIGLARYAGLRREEISHAKAGWIEIRGDGVYIGLRDRPDEKWWTKTGKAYRAQVIDADLAAWLTAFSARPPETLIIGTPIVDNERARWFERIPQEWLKKNGIPAACKRLHRLRGLYADQLAELTADFVAAQLAGMTAAQKSLGHTTLAVTKNHYLTPKA